MATPIYDETTLPCITFPLDVTQEASKRYLGGKALTGEVFAEINIHAKNDTEIAALHSFWVTDCNYGLDVFLIPLPVFGLDTDSANPALRVQFVGDVKDTKTATNWTTKVKLKIIGIVQDYLINDAGDYLVDDSGSYLVTSDKINSHKELSYVNS